MTAHRRQRGPHCGAVILDEVMITPVETVAIAVDGHAQTVIDWPRQWGLTLASERWTTNATLGGFLAAEGAKQRRAAAVARLADEQSLPRFLIRNRFDAVQRLLEEAGIADGYGRLTILQPVRPPVPNPARR